MLYQRKLLASLIIGGSLGLNAASASAVTSTFVFSNPTVSGGTGSLDVASYLGSAANFTSGTLDFSFTGTAGNPAYVSNNTTSFTFDGTSAGGGYSYCCGWSTCYSSYTNYNFSNSSTDYYSTPAESATVTVGASSASGVAPSNTTNVYNGTTSWSSWYGNGWDSYTTYHYSNTTTIGGNFNAFLGLDSGALSVLNNTGLLGFNLWTQGNVTLNQVAFNATYDLTPVASPVPEPETYAMLLAGLGLLGFTARRRKNNVY